MGEWGLMDTFRLRKPIDWTCRRIEQAELLDLGRGTERDVAQNLAEMQRINDFLGGTRALTYHLFPRLLLENRPVTILDLGTGGAGLPLTLMRWSRKLRLPLRVLAVDWSGRNLAVARSGVRRIPEIQLIRADALRLPLEIGRVDYVVSSLFLHHLVPEQLVRLFHEVFELASRAVIMSDLVRGWLPYWSYQPIQPIFARNYLTRHDGALSIRRAYTPEELERLAVRAGLPNAQVHEHFPWRMTLVVEKQGEERLKR